MGKIDSDDYWGNQIPRLLNYGKHGRLTIRSIKIVADGKSFLSYLSNSLNARPSGALGSWGAALLKPYSDNSKTKGLLLHSPENLSKLIHQFWKDDWQTVGTSNSIIFLVSLTILARMYTVLEIEPTTKC